MATTTTGILQADAQVYLARETLPVAQKELVVHPLGQKYRLPKGHGTTMTFSRYMRVNPPTYPLSEAVPSVSQLLSIQQVMGSVQQWGGSITSTDVGALTLMHSPFEKSKDLAAIQLAETLERNDILTLGGATQRNYANKRGSRAALVAGDVLNPFDVARTVASMADIKAPMFNGPPASQPNPRRDMHQGTPNASGDPRSKPHYVAVSRVFPLNDLAQNSIVQTAWSRNDINRWYNNEVGEYGGVRFCSSNMMPSYTGVALVSGANAVGSLATNTYYLQVTGVDANGFESLNYQVSTGISVTTGGIVFTTPATAGYTYRAYIGLTASPANYGAVTTGGPLTGPMTGQAVDLPPSTSVTITGVGFPAVPPAPPATGVTVYPIYIMGTDAFGTIELEGGGVEWSYLDKPEKADIHNQTKIVAWKMWQGSLILNSQFITVLEVASAFGPTFG